MFLYKKREFFDYSLKILNAFSEIKSRFFVKLFFSSHFFLIFKLSFKKEIIQEKISNTVFYVYFDIERINGPMILTLCFYLKKE